MDPIIFLHQPLLRQFLISVPSRKNIPLTIIKLFLLGSIKSILIHILLQLLQRFCASSHSSKFIQVKRIQHFLNLSFGQRRIKRLQYRFDFVNFKEASFAFPSMLGELVAKFNPLDKSLTEIGPGIGEKES